MSDWQVGDLAVCVNDTPRPHKATGELPPFPLGIVKGAIYTVSGFNEIEGLFLAEAPHTSSPLWHRGFDPDRFRKVTPDKHEACEEEFVTLLNRTKRTVKA